MVHGKLLPGKLALIQTLTLIQGGNCWGISSGGQFSGHDPKHSIIELHQDCLSNKVDSLSFKYDNVILLGDFNSCMEDSPMKTFGENYKLRNFIKDPTCFKNQRILYA